MNEKDGGFMAIRHRIAESARAGYWKPVKRRAGVGSEVRLRFLDSMIGIGGRISRRWLAL